MKNKISASIDINKLERESNRWLWLGTLLGVLIHALLVVTVTFEFNEPVKRKQIPIKLVFRREPLRNPYENWKRDIRKKERTRHITNTVTPDIEQPRQADQSLDVPLKVDIDEKKLADSSFSDNVHDSAEELIVPFVLPKFFESLKTERKLSDLEDWDDLMSLGLIDSMGIIKSLLVIDPNDRKNLKGFFHIPIYVSQFRPGTTSTYYQDSGSYNLNTVVPGMSETFEHYTGLRLIVDEPVSLTSLSSADYPLVYMTFARDDVTLLNENDLQAFGEYLQSGGFAIMDNGMPWREFSPDEASFLNILNDALGEECEIRPVPPEHFIFHSFFDMAPPLPVGMENIARPERYKRKRVTARVLIREQGSLGGTISTESFNVFDEPWTTDWRGLLHDSKLEATRKYMAKAPDVLWGAWLGDRLVAVYSDKGYGHIWKSGVVNGDNITVFDNKYNLSELRPQLELGVNLFVYALLRNESKVQRFIDFRPEPGKTARLQREAQFKMDVTIQGK